MIAAVALPVVPAAAGLLGLLVPACRRRVAAALAVGATAAALALASWLVAADRQVGWSTSWLDVGGVDITAGVWVTPTAALLAVVVAAVALAVQVYSPGYLRGDDRYGPYAAQVSLFTGAMLLVVVASDLFLLLVGWEVMGLCSYVLIAHDRRLAEAPRAAVKAFLVTRIGDVGFLLGVVLLGVGAGSFRIADVLAHTYDPATLTAAGLLLLAGVAGKSAQFPLHTWLPDAMAGPTPISALIHAATMVAAGVYVLARLFPLLAGSATTMAALAVVAAATLLLGAFAATAQDDIKRVLAWSTVSQLGYMTGALAVAAPAAAMFHLVTHAAFKALLFLAAGAVIHAVGGNLMPGGLRRAMPVTFAVSAVGLGALAGVPPLSGFFSKEGVLVAAAAAPGWTGWLVWSAMLLGVPVTAWYATRLLLLTFFGPARTDPPGPETTPPTATVGRTANDPPWSMRGPMLALAAPAAVLGLAVFAAPWRSLLGLAPPHLDAAVALPTLLTVLGAAGAWWGWRRSRAGDPAVALGRLRPWLAVGFGVDAVQSAVVVRPVTALARATRNADAVLVGGTVAGVGRAVSRLGVGLLAAHRASLPRATTFALAGVLLLTLALAVGGVR
ncbi:NADH-quinone oxidoreductase subunit L [Pilimelia columellifera]|uniref:NADH-quinone oxidoreductase subunit L n=1 Tax=Pilimelia columellifera subsp. columellifera TaxID=706583 RepID=A0ABN3NEU9_9ACTN